MRILLVEDEMGMAENVRAALGRHEILIDHATTVEMAEEALLGHRHDAILLDRKLPDGDGLSIIPIFRKVRPGVPIIVMSAMGASRDRIAGLDLGADDYLPKPFALDELVARLRAVMRRNFEVAPQEITLGTIGFDSHSRHFSVRGAMLELPRRELLILEALIRRAGRTVVREALVDAVYGYDDDIASNTLDAHISRLRKRLAETDAGVEIHAVRGIGYFLKASR